ncbi:hypothetical protein BHE74_00033626 [Ensete ventricosum]|nr:hypothetical protein BHE74_00033626 [Ensete ventricosum]
MSQPCEVTRVHKVAFVVWRLDSAIPTLDRFLRKRLVHPSRKKTRVSSLYASHVIAIVPDMPPAARYQGCCKLVGSSHSLLPCRRLPAVRGAIGWSPHRVCSAMSPATLPRC